jgi:hypothetical protein
VLVSGVALSLAVGLMGCGGEVTVAVSGRDLQEALERRRLGGPRPVHRERDDALKPRFDDDHESSSVGAADVTDLEFVRSRVGSEFGPTAGTTGRSTCCCTGAGGVSSSV